MLTAERVRELLDLQPHPKEGGYFRETYRCALVAPPGVLGDERRRDRSLSTAIYYLLTPDTSSAMHLLPGDEMFHFYLGDPVEMLQLLPDGASRHVTLGTDLAAGHSPQAVVPGGTWQGSRLIPGGRFALMGATMAPGFDYADYVHGDRATLVSAYRHEEELIRALTPGG